MQRQPSLFDLPIDFISFGSGSSGNCYYLRQGDYGVLIDLGVGIRRFQKFFNSYGFKLPQVKAVLLTHDHMDHVRAAGVLSRKMHWPIYATQAVHDGMQRNPVIKQKVPQENVRILRHYEPFDLGPFRIEPFGVPHDASCNTGYLITCDNVTFCLVTDIGRPTPEIRSHIARARYLVIESNYDPDMLASGPYPFRLQERIRNGHGHLSNPLCAELVRDHADPALLERLWLCHLSQENNTPDKARLAVQMALSERGFRCVPEPLRRTEPTGVFTLV